MTAFVVQDSEGMFVDQGSLCFISRRKKWKYKYSKYLTSGFYTYPTSEECITIKNNLNTLAETIGFNRKFYVKQIDADKIAEKESQLKGVKFGIECKWIDCLMNGCGFASIS